MFNVFLVRNFMAALPEAMRESAKIDGANDVRIALQIYFPLSLPVLATITLFYGLNYWNDWYNCIMLVSDTKLYPLQYLLFELQSRITEARELSQIGVNIMLPGEAFKMATVVVTVGPIVLLYPFLQRYFVKGITVGAVKG